MSTARALYHMMLADFRERVRRYSFLIVLVAVIAAGYSMVPSISEPYNAFAIGIHRPYYSSAWVGTIFGSVVATLLTLLGFFLVRDAVPRDYRTRVGQIIATTPISRIVYMLGKWLSNLAVFVAMLSVLTIVALIMQLIRAEDMRVDIWGLAAPIWCMGLPTLALVAALSILLESLPIPGIIGNVIFIALWTAMLLLNAGPIIVNHGDIPPTNDIVGISRTMTDIRDVMIANGLDPTAGVTDLYQPTQGRETIRFVWEGVSWNPGILFQRLLWLLLAIPIALAAAIPFDRFDPARSRIGADRKRKKRPSGKQTEQACAQDSPADSLPVESLFAPDGWRLSSLGQRALSGQFLSTVIGELSLMLKARSWWWYCVALGLFIACLASPAKLSLGFFAPLAWLWPMLLWSGMGSAEQTHRTNQLVFSSAHIVRRQLPALWLSGVIVAIAATAAMAIRLVLSGEWFMLFGWLVGVLFVPSLALALGVWTNSGRAFEMVYFVIWFIGVWHPVKLFDFMGRSGADAAALPFYYLAITAVLFVFAVLGRRKQVA